MSNQELTIYEGAMCCATGICGPEPDRKLIEFNETLKRLTSDYNGNLKIMRASLVFNSLLFFANPEIARLVKENGPAILPITTVNGSIVARQKYMTYAEIKNVLEKETLSA
ncbi:MAG: arsenic metallochaperone ArsD family protein [Syntrophales bacterium]